MPTLKKNAYKMLSNNPPADLAEIFDSEASSEGAKINRQAKAVHAMFYNDAFTRARCEVILRMAQADRETFRTNWLTELSKPFREHSAIVDGYKVWSKAHPSASPTAKTVRQNAVAFAKKKINAQIGLFDRALRSVYALHRGEDAADGRKPAKSIMLAANGVITVTEPRLSADELDMFTGRSLETAGQHAVSMLLTGGKQTADQIKREHKMRASRMKTEAAYLKALADTNADPLRFLTEDEKDAFGEALAQLVRVFYANAKSVDVAAATKWIKDNVVPLTPLAPPAKAA